MGNWSKRISGPGNVKNPGQGDDPGREKNFTPDKEYIFMMAIEKFKSGHAGT
jgi:hypothetical protein